MIPLSGISLQSRQQGLNVQWDDASLQVGLDGSVRLLHFETEPTKHHGESVVEKVDLITSPRLGRLTSQTRMRYCHGISL